MLIGSLSINDHFSIETLDFFLITIVLIEMLKVLLLIVFVRVLFFSYHLFLREAGKDIYVNVLSFTLSH